LAKLSDSSEMARMPQATPERFRLTRFLCPYVLESNLPSVDSYRCEFESTWGPTDLTRAYTSQLPQEFQAWLLKNEPRRYYLGLPRFFQAYQRGCLELAAQVGKLDDMPDGYVRLFTSDKMDIRGERAR